MSIPAGKRKPGQLIARTKTKAYVDYTTQTLTQEKNVPKRYRWVISGRILKCSQDMYIDICRANRVVVTDLNTFAYRATLQSMALDNAEVLFALMDLAEQHFHLDSNKVLHWTKEAMRIKCYQRYMDDFIIIHSDLNHIRACYNGIKQRIEEMGLTFNPKKTVIQPLVNVPIRYLGYNFTVLDTGKLIIKITHQKITRERRRIRTQAQLVRQGRMTLRRFHLNYRSWRSTLDFGNNYKVRLKMDAYFKEIREQLTTEIKRSNDNVKKLADGRR